MNSSAKLPEGGWPLPSGPMAVSVAETVIVALCGLVLLFAVAVTTIDAARGKDLERFDRFKTTAPREYRRMKTVCRFNAPLVALLCIFVIVASPFAALSGDVSWLAAIAAFAFFSLFLWLSVRWFRWSLRD